MEFLDLPDECVLLVLGHLPVPSTVTCAATCKRLRALVHSDSLWIPRIRDELGVNIKVCFHLDYFAFGRAQPRYSEDIGPSDKDASLLVLVDNNAGRVNNVSRELSNDADLR